MDGRIPTTVLTGFLGSGKTTLLGRLLTAPQLSRTAVIINEFGEIGLDHELIATSDESFVTLTTGCLCCTVRSDLVMTLHDLLARRREGAVMPFERVVIETSGLADPAPILQALMTDPLLAEALAVAGVVTTVDAVTGAATLDREPEALKQAAIADRLVLTKTDLVSEPPDALTRRLAALNPLSPLLVASHGAIAPDVLIGDEPYDATARSEDAQRWLVEGDHAHAHHPHDHSGEHEHPDTGGITSFTLVRETPIAAAALTALLEILAEHCGSDLLRLKGLVALAESPDRPAVVHAVQHVVHPLSLLDAWPSTDKRTRLVLIGRRVTKAWVEAVLAAVEAEAADVTRTLSASGQPRL